MLRIAQRSSALGVGARLLASSSVVAQNDRAMSTKKAVVFNMGGSLVPAMSPVLSKYARQHNLTESELASKLFSEGDKGLMAQVEPALISRHGSEKANLADVVSAIAGIRAEGLKTGLISNAGGLNTDLIPVDKSLFDVVSPALKSDMLDKLNVDSSDVVYLDNLDANLKAAQALGMTTIKVEDIEVALTALEKELEVPLKEFLPGFTWMYFDSANSPHKNTGENVLYYFLAIYILMVVGEYSVKNVFKIDGTSELHH